MTGLTRTRSRAAPTSSAARWTCPTACTPRRCCCGPPRCAAACSTSATTRSPTSATGCACAGLGPCVPRPPARALPDPHRGLQRRRRLRHRRWVHPGRRPDRERSSTSSCGSSREPAPARGVSGLRDRARRAFRRELLEQAAHATFPERRIGATAGALRACARLDGGIVREPGAWRLLAGAAIGPRATAAVRRALRRAPVVMAREHDAVLTDAAGPRGRALTLAYHFPPVGGAGVHADASAGAPAARPRLGSDRHHRARARRRRTGGRRTNRRGGRARGPRGPHRRTGTAPRRPREGRFERWLRVGSRWRRWWDATRMDLAESSRLRRRRRHASLAPYSTAESAVAVARAARQARCPRSRGPMGARRDDGLSPRVRTAGLRCAGCAGRSRQPTSSS